MMHTPCIADCGLVSRLDALERDVGAVRDAIERLPALLDSRIDLRLAQERIRTLEERSDDERSNAADAIKRAEAESGLRVRVAVLWASAAAAAGIAGGYILRLVGG